MIDLLIQGGQVVTPQGVGVWDIAIKDGIIVAVSLPNVLTHEATRIIDAKGKIVTPGGIEPHAYLNHYITMHKDANLYSLGPPKKTLSE
jgi:dihydroorotase-like cyclic amidohydrolase